MKISINNWEEEITPMKAMLEKLIKKSEEKESYIKLRVEKITRLIRKLEKHPTQSLTKNSEIERGGKGDHLK